MDDMCPNSSAYEPSSLVSSFHNIPHVNIDLNASPDNFELSLAYFEAVIIWACVPILCVVCLFILMAVYFICVCCCCCFQQHDKRSKGCKGVCGSLVMLLVLSCLAMVGVGFWAEFELDRNILESVNAARNASDIIDELRNVSDSYVYDTSGIGSTLSSLEMGINALGDSNADQAEASAVLLSGINQGLGSVFSNIQGQAVPIDLGNLDPVFTSIDFFEVARHWAVFAYLIVTVILLVLVAVSICCSACCASPVCMVIMLVVFFFVTFTMWVAVGGNLALLVVSGDICFNPETLIRNYTTLLPNTTVSTELLDYYLICNQTCYPSPFQSLFDNATTTFMTIDTNEMTIQQYFNTNPNSVLESQLNSVVADFNGAETTINEIAALADCVGLNDEFLNVLNNLCTEGYMFSVILFAMACGIAVFMMLIMVCGSFYAGLLSEGRVYDDETVVYDFPNSGSSPWDAYGTNQHYTPHGERESFNMRTSPQPQGTEPPKYTELSHRFEQTDGPTRHSNGAQFADDGTVGVNIRHSNGGAVIDLGEPLDP